MLNPDGQIWTMVAGGGASVVYRYFAGVGSVVKYIAISAGGLWFESRANQVEPNFANGSPPLRRFFGAVLPRRPPLVTRFGVIPEV